MAKTPSIVIVAVVPCDEFYTILELIIKQIVPFGLVKMTSCHLLSNCCSYE